MQPLKSFDYVYVSLSSIISVWQWWCINHGKDNVFSIILLVLMGLPFALASYAQLLLRPVAVRHNWARIIVLWAGMPLSLVAASLIILAETGVLYAAGFGTNDLPFDFLRLLIGEGAASLVWAICLLMSLREPGRRVSKTRILGTSAAILAGALLSQALSKLILSYFHKDIYFLLTSLVVTTLSAFVVILLRHQPEEAAKTPDLAGET